MTDILSFPDRIRVDVAEALSIGERKEVNELWLPRYLDAVRLATFAAYHVRGFTVNSAFTPEERSGYMDRAFDAVFSHQTSLRVWEDEERREAQPDIAGAQPKQEPSA